MLNPAVPSTGTSTSSSVCECEKKFSPSNWTLELLSRVLHRTQLEATTLANVTHVYECWLFSSSCGRLLLLTLFFELYVWYKYSEK